MAYEKNIWKTGDIVTSAKLNHMEDGIADGTFLITVVIDPESPSMATLDKTWKEIHDAFLEGKQCVVVWDQSYDDNVSTAWSIVSELSISNGLYHVTFGYNSNMFSTSSEDGYPEMNLD